MTFTHPRQRNDWIALETARLVARGLREDPALVEKGKEQIRRSRERERDFSAYREWETLLATRTVEQIATLLEAENDEGQRLRSSRPFIGPPFVSDQERKEILERAFSE